MYENFVKRLLDIVLSGIGIVVLAVPMLVVAIFIRIADRGPAIFKQKRIGKDKKYFILHNVRAMKSETVGDVDFTGFSAA